MSDDDEYGYDSSQEYVYEDPTVVAAEYAQTMLDAMIRAAADMGAAGVRLTRVQRSADLSKALDIIQAFQREWPGEKAILTTLRERRDILKGLLDALADASPTGRAGGSGSGGGGSGGSAAASAAEVELTDAQCDSLACARGSTGVIKLAVTDPVSHSRHCMCYSLRRLADHVSQHGWTEYIFGQPLTESQIARVKAALAVDGRGCFVYDQAVPAAQRIVPLAPLSEATLGMGDTVESRGSVMPGTVLIPTEEYSQLLENPAAAGLMARGKPLVVQIVTENAMVLCTPEPYERGLAHYVSPQDYTALTRLGGADVFQMFLVDVPYATGVRLDDATVDLEQLSTAIAGSGRSLLRAGDVFSLPGTHGVVAITEVKPSCAALIPQAGSRADLEVLLGGARARRRRQARVAYY